MHGTVLVSPQMLKLLVHCCSHVTGPQDDVVRVSAQISALHPVLTHLDDGDTIDSFLLLLSSGAQLPSASHVVPNGQFTKKHGPRDLSSTQLPPSLLGLHTFPSGHFTPSHGCAFVVAVVVVFA
mmetsp:Transcript_29809/g.45639  ORF Transcript_29809/g.45639 Transcript_29809/m.45639 type:complete len:124 (+) Transcript_29809:318-689(+)